EQDGPTSLAVVGHCCVLTTGRSSGGRLTPCNAVPLPCIAEPGTVDSEAAEQNRASALAVVGHRPADSGPGACGSRLRPIGSVPLPSVIEASEQVRVGCAPREPTE